LQRNPVIKNALKVAALASLLASFSAFAHHPAADIVAEDIYLMIDANVVTPRMPISISPAWAGKPAKGQSPRP
jgi:hypothetical protein